MRLPGLLAVTLLVLLPSASAGSERDPDLSDPVDISASNLDLVAAWFEGEARGLRFSIQTVDGSLPQRYPDCIYWVVFTIRSTGQQAAAVVGFGDDGVFRGHLTTGRNSGGLDDPNTPWTRGIPFEVAANGRLVGLSDDRGRPSTWSAVIPWDALEGFEPGATLTGITIGSTFYDRDLRQWTGAADTARMNGVVVAEKPTGAFGGLFPILVPQWVIPTIVLACTAGGAWAGLAIARGRKRAPAKAATSVPVHTTRAPPPPPGQRFQRAPPTGKP